MAYLDTAPAGVDVDQDVAAEAQRLELETVKRAATTGDAIRTMYELGHQLKEGGPETEEIQGVTQESRAAVGELIQNDASAAEDVVGSNTNLKLNVELVGTSTKGRAFVGGGDGGVELANNAVVGLSDAAKAEEANDLIAHERSHANDQKPMGSVYTTEEVTSFDLHELRSEKAGAEARGENENTVRDDAPPEYVEAHGTGAELEQWGVSSDRFDEHIAAGDTVGLQADLIEGGLDRGKLRLADVVKNAAENGAEYANAAERVLQEREFTNEEVAEVLALAA